MRTRDSWRDCERAVHVPHRFARLTPLSPHMSQQNLLASTSPQSSCFRGYRRLLHPCYCRSSFVVSVVSSSSFRTFVLRLVMYRTYTHCHLTRCDDWSEVHMPSAWGRAELRAGAAAVAIGVRSPVAHLGADGRWRREARGPQPLRRDWGNFRYKNREFSIQDIIIYHHIS